MSGTVPGAKGKTTMTNSEIALKANQVSEGSRRGGAPTLTESSSRMTLIAWFYWNDPNGCFSDEAHESEDMDPMTLDEAWEYLALALEGV